MPGRTLPLGHTLFLLGTLLLVKFVKVKKSARRHQVVGALGRHRTYKMLTRRIDRYALLELLDVATGPRVIGILFRSELVVYYLNHEQKSIKINAPYFSVKIDIPFPIARNRTEMDPCKARGQIALGGMVRPRWRPIV